MRRKPSMLSLIPADLLRTTRQELALPDRLGELRGLHEQMIRLSRAVLIAGCEPLRRKPAASAASAKEPAPAKEAAAATKAAAPGSAVPGPPAAPAQAGQDAAPLALCATDDEPPPVPGYAGLGRRRLAAFFKDCSDEQLAALRAHEAASLRRVTVLRQIDRELAARRLRRPDGAPE